MPRCSSAHPRMAYDTYFTILSVTVNFQNGLDLVSICHHPNHLHVSSVMESFLFSNYTPFSVCSTSSGTSLRPCPPIQWLGAGTWVAKKFKRWFSPSDLSRYCLCKQKFQQETVNSTFRAHLSMSAEGATRYPIYSPV